MRWTWAPGAKWVPGEAGAALASLIEEPSSRPPALRRSAPRLGWLAAALLLATLSFWVGFAAHTGEAGPGLGKGGILASLCNRKSPLLIVMVDANLPVYCSVFGKQVRLEDYIKRQYEYDAQTATDPRIASIIDVATDSNDTNVSSTMLAVAVRRESPDHNLEVKHPRSVSTRDFQTQSSVLLLGGPWSNPWGQLFEDQTNFRLIPVPSPCFLDALTMFRAFSTFRLLFLVITNFRVADQNEAAGAADAALCHILRPLGPKCSLHRLIWIELTH
jgi:hypothetical protein